jgi:polyisoprenoid-binding protein YceI
MTGSLLRRAISAAAVSLALAAAAVACGPALTQDVGQPPSRSAGVSPAPEVDAVQGSAERLTLVKDEAEARYKAHETLANQRLPVEAIGRTRDMTGSIALTTDGRIAPDGSKITVVLNNLKSDERLRDRVVGDVLQTKSFPYAEFVPREIAGLSGLPPSGEASFKLAGDLTLHGVTRPATWEVTAQFAPGEVNGKATTVITLESFDMKRPILGPVLSIEQNLTLELDFKATRGS